MARQDNIMSGLKPPHIQILKAIYILSLDYRTPTASEIQKKLSGGKKKKATGALRRKLKFLEGLGLIKGTRISQKWIGYTLTKKGKTVIERYIVVTEGEPTLAKESEKPVKPIDRLHDLIVKIEYTRIPDRDQLLKYGFQYYNQMKWDEYVMDYNNYLIIITTKNVIIMPKFAWWGDDPYLVMREALEDLKKLIDTLQSRFGVEIKKIHYIDATQNIEITNMHHGFQEEAFAQVLAYYGLLPESNELKDQYEHIEFDASEHMDPITGEKVRVPEADLKHKHDAPDDFKELAEFETSFPSAREAYEFAESIVTGKNGWHKWREIPEEIEDTKEKLQKNLEGISDVADYMSKVTEILHQNQQMLEQWFKEQGAILTGNMTLIQNVQNMIRQELEEFKKEIEKEIKKEKEEKKEKKEDESEMEDLLKEWLKWKEENL